MKRARCDLTSWMQARFAAGLVLVSLFSVDSSVRAGTNAFDSASNYGLTASWTNGANLGFGFTPWVLNSSGGTNGFAGNIIADPAGAGIAGMPVASFGQYANPLNSGAFATASRGFLNALTTGGTFSFLFGMNWDSGGGNKGFNLYSGGIGGNQLVNINNSASQTITIDIGGSTSPMFTNYGTNAFILNFSMIDATTLAVFGIGRDGLESYSNNITVGTAPNAFQFYSSGLSTNVSTDLRQMYFDNLQISSAQIGNLFVGDDSSGNALNFSSGTHTYSNTFVGFQQTASHNRLTVTGAGTLLTNSDNYFIGRAGSSNSLVVSDGGKVAGSIAYVGYDGSSSNNTVLVTGQGSVITNSAQFVIGESGSGNRLVISNGGTLANSWSIVGYGASASNNSVLVTGAGSRWTNSAGPAVGDFGSGNSLVVSNSGAVANSYAYIGRYAGSSGNSVLVTGAGSTWENNGLLQVGGSGVSNRLTVADEALVSSLTGDIGYETSASNNAVLVSGAGSLWTNSGSLHVGRNGSANTLIVAGGGVVASTFGRIGTGVDSSNNSVLVTGTGSLWTNSGSDEFHIGSSGSGNSLTISNGGRVVNSFGRIGSETASSSNSVLVTGAGSLWTNSGSLRVGSNGAANSLIVADGGVVASTFGRIGTGADASNNSVLVTGSGSLWTNSSSTGFHVGGLGSGNSLTISDGGTVANSFGRIGSDTGSSNNSVLVTGTGSLWNNSESLRVGRDGSFNRLVISNGGAVVSEFAYVGDSANSSNNSVVVSGTGSTWTSRSNAFVGYLGSGNSLVVSHGGVFASYFGCIGHTTNSSNNSVRVTGAGSLLTNANFLFVGDEAATGNTLVVSNSGTVASRSGFVGYSNSWDNSAVVTGIGSLWTNSESIAVGRSGSGNSLVVSGGGAVIGGIGLVGGSAGSSNNSVLVAGAGSVWSNAGVLTLGELGSGTMTVADSATVAALGGINIAVESDSVGVLNVGSPGGSDSAGTVNSPTIAFGSGNGTINFNQTNTTILGSAISGNGSLNQLGSGTTILTANNTYIGPTTVAKGSLLVEGSASSSAFTVGNGGVLGGSGAIGMASISAGGSLAPGSSIESLAAGSLAFADGSTYVVELNSGALSGLAADVTISSGDLTLVGSVSLTLSDVSGSPSAFALGTTFSLISYTGTWNTGLFSLGGSQLADGAAFIFGLNTWKIVYNSSSGGVNFASEYLPNSSFVNITTVPEPSTLTLLALGLAGLVCRLVRRRSLAKFSGNQPGVV